MDNGDAVLVNADDAQITGFRITNGTYGVHVQSAAHVLIVDNDIFENVKFLQPKVTESDVIIFARQFSTMIDAGLHSFNVLKFYNLNKKIPHLKRI